MSTIKPDVPPVYSANGDQILPFRFMDSSYIFENILPDLTFLFDDVLDAEKLRKALERLLEIGEWKYMGHRIRRNTKGKLEYHIPSHFDEKRPGFLWSQDKHQGSISEHPLACRIKPNPSSTHPSLHTDGTPYHDFLTAKSGHATKFKDYLDTDRPPLAIHVVSFSDATVVTLSWPHTYLDAMGRESLFRAWIAVLEGREEDVPKLIPFDRDPVAEIAQTAKAEENRLYQFRLVGFWYIMFVAGFIFEILFHRKEAVRIMCFPGPWVDEMREEAMVELKAKGMSESEAFLSHGDVLLAYWSKLTLTVQNFSANQPLNIMNASTIRGLFPKELPSSSNDAYLGNAVLATSITTTVGELKTTSVGELAFRLRQALKEQRTPEQFRSLAKWAHDAHLDGDNHISGPWNQVICSISNWHRAKFFELDFSSAVVKSGNESADRVTKPGRPSYMLTNSHVEKLSVRNAGPLMGRDAGGNWWLTWCLRAECWPRIEEIFDQEALNVSN